MPVSHYQDYLSNQEECLLPFVTVGRDVVLPMPLAHDP